jgi:hypothetical protein
MFQVLKSHNNFDEKIAPKIAAKIACVNGPKAQSNTAFLVSLCYC